MSCFNVHFFIDNKREKMHAVTKEALARDIIEYFQYQGNSEIEANDDKVECICKHPHLDYTCRFIFTRSSVVPNLYRLNPGFIDLKLHLEIDLFTPNYVADEFLKLVANLAERFNLHTFTEFLEDVGLFNHKIYLECYDQFKEAYLERDHAYASRFYRISKPKMDAILRYTDELSNLQQFYSDALCVVPEYRYLIDEMGKVKLAISWNDNTATLFPPYIDYIYYKTGYFIYLYQASDLFNLIEDYLEAVPGFIKEAKLISRQSLKKAVKIIKKANISDRKITFKKTSLKELID